MSKLIGNYKSALFNVILFLFAISLFIGCQKEESKLDSHINSEESLNTGSPTRSLTLKDSLYVVDLFNKYSKSYEHKSEQEQQKEFKKLLEEEKKLSNEQFRLFMHMTIDIDIPNDERTQEEIKESRKKAKQAWDKHIDQSIELFGFGPHLLSNEQVVELSEYRKKK